MDTVKINKGNVLMIAHRGVSGLERENTKEAFILAGKKTYYGIETDIHVTKDGKFIVCHDHNILRVTGVDLVIEDSNYEDIIKHKIYNFNTEEKKELVFPYLTDYLTICKKYDKQAILEIKTEVDELYASKIVEEVINCNWYDKTTIISFNLNNLLHIRKKYDIKLQFLTGELDEELLNVLINNKIGLDYYFKNLTKDIVDYFHSNNLDVNCWTVDDEDDAYKLIQMGVDMITSNILE